MPTERTKKIKYRTNTAALPPEHTALTQRLVTDPAAAPTGMSLMEQTLGHLPGQGHPHPAAQHLSQHPATARLPQQLLKAPLHCHPTRFWWNQDPHSPLRSSPACTPLTMFLSSSEASLVLPFSRQSWTRLTPVCTNSCSLSAGCCCLRKKIWASGILLLRMASAMTS